MPNPSRIRAFPAALSLSAFFLTSCLIIAGPDRTVERLREQERVGSRRPFKRAWPSPGIRATATSAKDPGRRFGTWPP